MTEVHPGWHVVPLEERTPAERPWFTGRYDELSHPRTCAVCGDIIAAGSGAIIDEASGQVAHVGCGCLARRGR